MYDIMPQLFVALFGITYLVLLAAQTWWALGAPFDAALKKGIVLAAARARRTLRVWLVQLKRRKLKSRTGASTYTAPSSVHSWRGQ